MGDCCGVAAGKKDDKVGGGGGASDWIEVAGGVFVRATWMTEMGEMAADYGSV